MTREERIRFRDFIFEALMVREHWEITPETAMERANNISMGVDADFIVAARRNDTPTGYDVHGESAEQMADRLIK